MIFLNKKIKKMNNQGVAMLMVISTITLLSLLMFSFKFETTVNKIKAFNTTGKYQARLNAESGLHLSLIQLEIYQNILNYLNENPNLRSAVPAELINMVWNQPLPLNLEIIEGMGLLEKSAIEEVKEGLLMEGEINTNISSYANKINLNSMILTSAKEYRDLFKKKFGGNTQNPQANPNANQGTANPNDPNDPNDPQNQKPDQFKELETRLKELIENAINRKMENDEDFRSQYSGIDIDELIANIKYYLLDEGEDIGPLSTQVQSEFEKAGITPKHAPMTSLSEMNLLPAWNDELIELVKNEITVHGKMVINVNTISDAWLNLIAPDMTEENIKTFRQEKQENPDLLFNSDEELKRYFLDKDWIVESDFDDKITILKNAGIVFGIESELFQITSTGVFQNAKYTINAIVSIPRKEKPPKKAKTTPGAKTTTGGGQSSGQSNNSTSKPKKEEFNYTRPKVLEIFVN